MESWNTGNETAITKVQNEVHEEIHLLGIRDKLNTFIYDTSSGCATFALASQYMNIVVSVLRFIRVVRCGQWNVRLAAFHDFTKYFFTIDLRSYAAMSALHICQMASLRNEDPETWKHLEAEEWAPNKSGRSFCRLGADEALEQSTES